MLGRIRKVGLMTFATILLGVGIYYFKFANNFNFGGVSGLSVLVGKTGIISAGTFNLIANLSLLVLGLFILGKKAIGMTAYCSILLSLTISFLEKCMPLYHPLTDEPVLEFCFAIILPAIGSGILFNMGASSGGLDILAMILKKYTAANIATAFLIINSSVTLASFFFFDIETSLYSILGLAVSSLMIDTVIENINLCKYFNVVCTDPKPICDFITKELRRSATTLAGTGAFSGKDKYVILTAMNRVEAIKLRNFIKKNDPESFILISNTSNIIGKGFRSA